MRKALVCLMLLAVPASALAAVDYFPVTNDGTWYMHDAEGYGARGDGNFRICKGGNQNVGYLDWDGTVGDNSGMGMGAYITAEGGFVVSAKLYIRLSTADLLTTSMRLVTLRAGEGNGNVLEANSSTTGVSWDAPDDDVASSSQAVAYLPGQPNVGAGYGFKGDFNILGGGQPWVTPSTRDPNHSAYGGAKQFAPNEAIVFGLFNDSGRDDADEIWAVEELLGFSWSQGGSTVARHLSAGQLVNAAHLDQAAYVGGAEPRDKAGDGETALEWYSVDIDVNIVIDIDANYENKGIIFTAYGDDCVWDWGVGNPTAWAKDQSGGAWEAYLALDVVPEPATLSLLALGGLALLRRRK